MSIWDMNVLVKSSLAFRKPAVAAASRHPARADGPKVGLDGPASLGAGSGVVRGQVMYPERNPDFWVYRAYINS